MSKKPKITLITGANGFIGANLVHAILLQSHNVHAVVRHNSNLWRLKDVLSEITLHKTDIADVKKMKDILGEVKPTHVFHLVHYGGNSGQSDSEEVRRVIVDGTKALYEACIGINSIKSIVNGGSSSEYGSKKEPMREDVSLEPNTDYGLAKAQVALYGQSCFREKKLPIITARLFSVYGPYEHRNRFMTEVILACLKGEQPKLTNPQLVRDFIFVQDAVNALLYISEHGKPGEIYNVGTGKESSLLEAAELITKYTKFDKELEWGTMENRSFDTNHWQANMSHTKKDLGWEARCNLEKGIKKTVDWFKEHKNLY